MKYLLLAFLAYQLVRRAFAAFRKVYSPVLTYAAVQEFVTRSLREKTFAQLSDPSEELFEFAEMDLCACTEVYRVSQSSKALLLEFRVYPSSSQFGFPGRIYFYLRSEEHLAWLKEALASVAAASDELDRASKLAPHEEQAVGRRVAELCGYGPSREVLEETVV
ncbi:MAG: hypothetical protein OEV30_05520 [Ignavibacteria bacterium]|nr:hypothetical protein [Ignavibacteria bacterium]